MGERVSEAHKQTPTARVGIGGKKKSRAWIERERDAATKEGLKEVLEA